MVDVPLFVSHRRLKGYVDPPRALGPWALDSGAFTELSQFGGFQTSENDYVEKVCFYADEVGQLEWAAPQDWMCEPFMLDKTGLTVADHQKRTIASVQKLRWLCKGVPIIPVLQGWTVADYQRHWEMYDKAGIDLETEPRIGVGSVCRRQATTEAVEIFAALQPLRLHGFGVKLLGLDRLKTLLASCDSMAWSLDARRGQPLPGHTHVHCGNCLEYALRWRRRAIERMGNVSHNP